MKPKGVHWGDHPVTPTSSGLGAAPGRLRLRFHRITNPLLLGGETASEEICSIELGPERCEVAF